MIGILVCLWLYLFIGGCTSIVNQRWRYLFIWPASAVREMLRTIDTEFPKEW